MSNKEKLPECWARSTVEAVYDLVGGGTPSTKNPKYWNGKTPWITSADIHGLKSINSRKCINQDGIRNSTTNLVHKDSLIVVTRVGLGKIGLADRDLCFSQDCQGLVDKHGIIAPLYALYYLSTAVQEFKHKNRGTTISGVTKKQLKELPIFIPPLNEQKRIVAKIEQLFSDLDAGIETLHALKKQIKQYRQSVLKYAFEGKLTAEWRKKNKPEPASKLLEKIAKERDTLTERRKCKLLPLESNVFLNIPEGWEIAILNDYCLDVRDGTHDTPKYVDEGIPFVTQKNIRHNGLDMSNTNYISKKDHENFHKRSNVEKNDIIISMIGANRGMSCIVDTDVVFSIKNVGLLKLFGNLNNLKYLDYYLKSELAQKIILSKSKGGAQQFIGLTELRSWAIIFPCLREQEQIVSEIERHISIADKAEEVVNAALKQSNRLRQSILKRAFEGKLVPQDPTDEPAEKLLERIKKEKV